MPPGARPVALGLAARAGDAGGTLSARMGSRLAELRSRSVARAMDCRPEGNSGEGGRQCDFAGGATGR